MPFVSSDNDSSFYAYQAVSRHEAFSFGVTQRAGWYLAENKKHTRYQADIGLENYSSDEKFLLRSSFALRPIRVTDDPLTNCVGVLKVSEAPINVPAVTKEQSGVSLPHSEKCKNAEGISGSVTTITDPGLKVLPSLQPDQGKNETAFVFLITDYKNI